MKKVYRLSHSYDHLIDMHFDASFEPFEGDIAIDVNMMGKEEFQKPDVIYLRANFNVIPAKTDFPITDLTFPILSKKMIHVLEKVRPFKHRLLNTIMVDDTHLTSYLDQQGELLSDVRRDNSYFGLQFSEYTEAFDYTNSIFTPRKSNLDQVGVIRKLVLKTPKDGFPSFFKIKENLTYELLSQDAKEALESNQIKGCSFQEIDVSE
jgi:hypothetical protein